MITRSDIIHKIINNEKIEFFELDQRSHINNFKTIPRNSTGISNRKSKRKRNREKESEMIIKKKVILELPNKENQIKSIEIVMKKKTIPRKPKKKKIDIKIISSEKKDQEIIVIEEKNHDLIGKKKIKVNKGKKSKKRYNKKNRKSQKEIRNKKKFPKVEEEEVNRKKLQEIPFIELLNMDLEIELEIDSELEKEKKEKRRRRRRKKKRKRKRKRKRKLKRKIRDQIKKKQKKKKNGIGEVKEIQKDENQRKTRSQKRREKKNKKNKKKQKQKKKKDTVFVEQKPIKCPFWPIINKECKVLILGTFPGQISVQNNFYFSYSGNSFWPIMNSILTKNTQQINTKLIAEEKDYYTNLLLSNHISLYVLIKTVIRKKIDSSDSSLKIITMTDLNLLLGHFPNIETILFTSQYATNIFKKHFKNINLPYFTLPSPSSRNTRMNVAEKRQKYLEIFKQLKICN
ncbi:bromodomain-containing protein [Anaeramoeba flamelloides]|uniref:Bromodomain-containing protein n=1 Tax=Anaeramoeba flamelloides TaxID=1746091 RepID=A0AAV8AFS3_9EUKA|nr:bromodomain-containing protein [Anaeramoeba flamelloides]